MNLWAKAIVVFIYLLPLGIVAQSSKIDSLLALVQSLPNSPKKVDLLCDLSVIHFNYSFESAQRYSDQAYTLAIKLNDKKGEARALTHQAQILNFQGKLPNAQVKLDESYKLAVAIKDSSLISYVLGQKGNLSRNQGFFEKALSQYDSALAICNAIGDHFGYRRGVVLFNKAKTLNWMNRPDDAIDAIKSANVIWRILGEVSKIQEADIEIGNSFRLKSEMDSAYYYISKVLENNPTGANHLGALHKLGEYHFDKGNFPEALSLWLEVLKTMRELSFHYETTYLLFRIGEVYQEQGYYDLAMQYMSSGLLMAQNANYHYIIGSIYYEMAWVHLRTNDHDKAIEAKNKSAAEFQLINKPLQLAGIDNTTGMIFLNQKMYDSAEYYLKLGLKKRQEINYLPAISSSLFNLGRLYNTKNEHAKALKYLHNGLKIDSLMQDNYGISLYSYEIANSYKGLNQKDSIRFYLDAAISLAVTNTANDVLEKSFYEMANYLQSIGLKDEAIVYLQKSIQVRDTVFSKRASQSLAAYQVLYEIESKENEIKLLNMDKAIAQANSEKQRLIVVGLTSGFSILIILLSYLLLQAKRLKKLGMINEQKANQLQMQADELSSALNELSIMNEGLEVSNKELETALTELNRAQQELIQAEKMASLGVMAAGIAHEINNPLNFIKGGADALRLILAKQVHLTNDEDINSLLQVINEGVERSTSIIKGLGSYSRQSNSMDEQCDIHKILENCLLILNHSIKYHIKVILQFSDAPFILKGNEGKLHQAFLNLLTNAEQAIEKEGSITIQTIYSENQKQVIISDTGVGISTENIKRLGDLFFTTKEPGKGTGLGLSITYRIIADHGGKVSVHSKLNEGSIFTISF